MILAAEAANVDYFLKIDGIDGESTDDRHRNEIDIYSFSWGESNIPSTATGGTGAGKVNMQDFHFVTSTSKASPVLFLKCATGEHIKQAVLTARKASGDQQEYLKVTMTDVILTSYQTSGAGEIPTDSFSLNFSKKDFEYFPQNPDGSLGDPVKASWDQKAGRRV